MGRGATQVLPLAALIAGAGVILALALSEPSETHELIIAAPTADWMRAGLDVRIAGQIVGTVTSAAPTPTGTARVTIALENRAWPLPAGTTASFRSPGTIAATNQYVELTAPRPNGHWLPNRAVISGQDVEPTVQLDQLFDTFTASTRASTKTLLDDAGAALPLARTGLAASLARAPAALTQAADLFEQLGEDPAAMDTLLRSGAGVVHAIQSSNPGIAQLIDGAAGTLQAVSSRTTSLRATLNALPPTLTRVRTTLGRADNTLLSANGLLQALRPGIAQVREIAHPLDSLLGTITQVAPSAEATLMDVRLAVPDLNPTLAQLTSLMPTIKQISTLGATEAACIRPYAPELAGFAGTWTGFIQRSDGTDKYARVNAGIYPYLDSNNPIDSAQVARRLPYLHYVFPAPPGEVAGQPRFNPSCGVGPDALNANNDPEAP
jgi:ABC-type transporter Mla subunit MlaD